MNDCHCYGSLTLYKKVGRCVNVGLVLSGGMAKGAYQIGALKAISEFISPQDFKYISGSSVGVLNGYAFATNKLKNAERIWKKVCNSESRILINKLLRSSFIQNSIEDIYSLEDCVPNSFYVSLLNINRKEIVYKDLKDVNKELIPLYLKASVAMPVYNYSVKIGEENFYDGALIDNIPVYPLLKYKLDYIICIYFDDCCYKFENTYFDDKIIKITFPVKNILNDSIVFRKESIDEMVTEGYKTTMYLLKSIFINGTEDIEYIYEYIKYNNKQNKNKKIRITGDVLVTNMNKVTQKLTRRKII